MGITRHSLNLVERYVTGYPKGITMLELGNQFNYWDPKNMLSPMKGYFQKLGVVHDSVDQNGKDGAHALDLGKPINMDGWIGRFDVVTDFGTSEHVYDLYECFANIHKFCKKGGIMIHENPENGSWPGHNNHWYYTRSFYAKFFTKWDGYELVADGREAAHGNTVNGWNVWCVMRKKNDKPFMSRSLFEEIMKDTIVKVTLPSS